MSVIDAPMHVTAQHAHEITMDLRRLREWTSPAGCARAAAELARVRRELIARGVRERSASRIASALGRYAFLTEEGCPPSRRALWRLYAVDEVPVDVLAGLTWMHVRPRLREIVVPGKDGTRYFALSGETCRLLRLARDDDRCAADSAWVFSPQPGEGWDPDCMAEMLAMISARSP